ncbi:MAG: glycoside hydrolase TIM-barrel-like domain-containing protein [Cyanobacteria bacterium P01_F01_bin.150]
MKRFIALMVTMFVAISCVAPNITSPSPPSLPPASIASIDSLDLEGKYRGVSWTAGNQEVTPDDFTSLVNNHVNWIVQTPFGWQDDYDTPQLQLVTEGAYWGETDEGLTVTTDIAHSLNIHTLLKPHIWLTNASESKWRTDIEMQSEDDWQRWFADYRAFILHYARFAQAHNIEVLCIGTELQTTAVQREADWRSLIAEIRQIYQGQLTYAANWYKAFEEIRFWDALDFIGIQAYFPLADYENPTLADLKAGWQRHIPSIEAVYQRYKKPVLFTELGYRSEENAAIAPWEWPDWGEELRPTRLATPEGLTTQSKCYEAFFQTVWPKDWFAGVYFWKWFPTLRPDAAKIGRGFTPQNKPAEEVMGKWYKQSRSATAHRLSLLGGVR